MLTIVYICEIIVGTIFACPTVDLCLCTKGACTDINQTFCLSDIVCSKGGIHEEKADKIFHHNRYIYGDILFEFMRKR